MRGQNLKYCVEDLDLPRNAYVKRIAANNIMVRQN